MLSWKRFTAVVAALMAGVCLVQAGVEAAFVDGRGFVAELLRPDRHDLALRIIGGLALLGGAFVWRAAALRRARTDRALAASEKLYRDLVENSPESIIVHRDRRILFLNRIALRFLGLSRIEDLGDHDLEDYIHPEDLDFTRERREMTMQGGEVDRSVTVRLVMPDGAVRHCEINSIPITFEGERAVLTFARDFTDDLRTRKSLAASQERLSLALEAARDGVWDWDMVSDRLVYNRAWAQMLGLEAMPGEHSPETWSNLVHPDDKRRALDAARAHIRGETPAFETEVRLRHADGRYIWVLDRGKVVERAEDGTPLRMTGTHRDITARKEAEMALELRNRIAEAFLTDTLERVHGRVLALVCEAVESPLGVLATFEPGARLRVTTHDRDGEDGQSFISRDTIPSGWQEVLEAGWGRCDNDAPPLALVGRPVARAVAVPVLSHGHPLGVLIVADRDRDYDEGDLEALGSLAGYLAPILEYHLASRTKEGQLRQAQKMEAIGALAEGIAHDFNNILQAVLGFSTLALEEAVALETEQGAFIASDLQRVVTATQRGRELVNRILLFSRRKEEERQPVAVGEVVTEAVALLANAIPATIALETRLDDACGPVLAAPDQVSLMLMNLATNGFHAMEQDGGVLTFTTGAIGAADTVAGVPERLRGRELVHLSVADTGTGMDEATLERLYDPFFTTKDVDKGTGLGLSVVHGIVAAHGGEIVIESAVGRGTTAHVYLPVHRALDEGAALDELGGGEPVARVKKGARILFLDDESDIGALGKALLEKQGHRVVAVDDTDVALSHLERSPDEFDLLITDLTMPRMTGDQLAGRVAQIRPDLPILLITGLNDLPTEALSSHAQIRGVLRKPFGGDTLRATVRQVLARTGTPDAEGAGPGRPDGLE